MVSYAQISNANDIRTRATAVAQLKGPMGPAAAVGIAIARGDLANGFQSSCNVERQLLASKA